jgi:hypothetical protein
VDFGISAGAGIEAAPRAVTERILTMADQAGYGAALIDAAAGASVITWPHFAHTVRAAGRGLSLRGLRESDTAGILVHDAISHVVAVHAVRAAGAIAVPIRPSQTVTDVAAQLKQHRARLLITSAALAELAIQAAERSWVRQVFAFGDAEGTTPFGSLLHTARHGQLQANGSTSHNGHSGQVVAQILDLAGPGPDGLAVDGLAVDGLVVDGLAVDGFGPDSLGPDGLGMDGLGPDGLGPDGLGLTRRDVVVAAPPCGDPDAYTSLLDLALTAGATIVAAPLPQVTAAVSAYKGTAAIVPRGTDVPVLPTERVFTLN